MFAIADPLGIPAVIEISSLYQCIELLAAKGQRFILLGDDFLNFLRGVFCNPALFDAPAIAGTV